MLVCSQSLPLYGPPITPLLSDSDCSSADPNQCIFNPINLPDIIKQLFSFEDSDSATPYSNSDSDSDDDLATESRHITFLLRQELSDDPLFTLEYFSPLNKIPIEDNLSPSAPSTLADEELPAIPVHPMFETDDCLPPDKVPPAPESQ